MTDHHTAVIWKGERGKYVPRFKKESYREETYLGLNVDGREVKLTSRVRTPLMALTPYPLKGIFFAKKIHKILSITPSSTKHWLAI